MNIAHRMPSVLVELIIEWVGLFRRAEYEAEYSACKEMFFEIYKNSSIISNYTIEDFMERNGNDPGTRMTMQCPMWRRIHELGETKRAMIKDGVLVEPDHDT